MRKHMKIGLIAIAAILALTAGLTAVSFADSPEADTGSDGGPRQVFISKVAEILGLDEEQVADAFIQAHQEMWDEFQQQRLQEAVENGLITEEEADQIQEWWDSRPEALQNMGQFHLRNARCHQMNLQ